MWKTTIMSILCCVILIVSCSYKYSSPSRTWQIMAQAATKGDVGLWVSCMDLKAAFDNMGYNEKETARMMKEIKKRIYDPEFLAFRTHMYLCMELHNRLDYIFIGEEEIGFEKRALNLKEIPKPGFEHIGSGVSTHVFVKRNGRWLIIGPTTLTPQIEP